MTAYLEFLTTTACHCECAPTGSSAAPLLPLSSGQSLNQEPAASQTPQQLAPANPLSAPPASTASGPASLPVAPAVSISTASPPASPPDPPAPVASTQLRVTNPAPAQAQVPSQGAAAFHGESPEDALLSVPDSQLDQSELALDSAALAPLAPGVCLALFCRLNASQVKLSCMNFAMIIAMSISQ